MRVVARSEMGQRHVGALSNAPSASVRMRTELVQNIPFSVHDYPATEPFRMLSSQFVEAYVLRVNWRVRGR